MKKFTIAVLAILYLGVSSGIAMEIHYCMGKKSGVGFFSDNDNKCGKCGMKEKKGGCCNDEHKFYKLSDAHKNIPAEIAAGQQAIALVPLGIPVEFVRSDNGLATGSLNSHSPPVYTGPSACILNCVFRL